MTFDQEFEQFCMDHWMNIPVSPEATLGVLRNHWELFCAWRKAKGRV